MSIIISIFPVRKLRLTWVRGLALVAVLQSTSRSVCPTGTPRDLRRLSSACPGRRRMAALGPQTLQWVQHLLKIHPGRPGGHAQGAHSMSSNPREVLRKLLLWGLFIYLFILDFFFFIYSFMKHTERERERGKDTGRGRSRLHAGRLTRDPLLGLQACPG